MQKENQYLLLDFWGTWCRGCTLQLPDLKNLANGSNKIQVLGLNYGDNQARIEKYLAKHDIAWPNGIANEEIMKKLRIDGFPNYLLIDKNGDILIMNGTLKEIEERLKHRSHVLH